ncbi:MAG TPA: DUF721 domain-containing protein [Actinomycetota bacterium]|nr:DUF721 domain-containing protein [Actinomycetota bacterium]
MPDDPTPLRSLLGPSARRWGLDNPAAVGAVFGDWRQMVGDRVAQRCSPASLTHGVLKVWVENPAWGKELQYLAPEIIRRVNAAVPGEPVKEVKVALKPPIGVPGGRPAGRAAARGAGQSSATAPIRTARPSGAGIDADQLVSGIPDDRLAAATKRALLAARSHSGRGH